MDYNFNKLTPFKWFILENFPFLEDSIDALTNYQLFCKLGAEINKIIESQNLVGEQVENLTTAFNQLKDYVDNYFENLDIQNEINNKLDEMAQDGTLTNLIKGYVDPIFNTYENTINERINAQDEILNTQNNTISAINNKVNASVGLTPLVADSIEEMTDTTKIYVLSTDGYWYYYDGEEWTAGAVYQATSYGENTIPSTSIKNVVYNKVDNNIVAKTLTSSNFTKLSNITMTEGDNDFTFRITSRSSNGSFRLTFTPDEINSDLHIITELSNLRCIPAVNIVTSGSHSLDNKILRNGISYFNLNSEDVKSTTTLQFTLQANKYTGITDGDIFITISKNMYFSTSNFYDFNNSENLSDYLNNLTKYKGIKNRYDYIDLNIPYGNETGIVSLTRTNNNYSITTSTSNRGIRCPVRTELTSKVHIKGNVPLDSDDVNVILAVTDSTSDTSFFKTTYSAGDVINLTLDLDFYAVYHDMVSWYIIINGAIGTFKFNNIECYIDQLSDLEIYANNLEDTIINIQNKFDTIESTIAQQTNILTAPNGSKYKLVVDNSGNLSTQLISLVPSKGLFIGNSLLLGFGTHGMASYSVNDDYYHYITEYFTTLNPSFTSSKVAGTSWESATNSSALNNFISTYITPNMTSDTDIVFIQLGDNCNTTERIQYISTKAPALINAIRAINPNAVIYWVGCWYNNTSKQTELVNACTSNNVKYINIASVRTQENQAYIGYEYLDANGETQTITSSGVASHPSSKGMLAIANTIIQQLDI